MSRKTVSRTFSSFSISVVAVAVASTFLHMPESLTPNSWRTFMVWASMSI